MHEQDDSIGISYRIIFDDGTEKLFQVKLDPDTLDLLADTGDTPPDWAVLDYHKCHNCTLDSAAHPHCPCAVNMVELIEFIKDMLSYTEANVSVLTNHREYKKRAPLQQVASSLMGIIMVASGCPVLSKLRPMVETHLPFASWEETAYRYVSMYMFAQYFRHKGGKDADLELTGLSKLFDDIEQVNMSFYNRLDSIRTKDASVNAVTILSSLGAMTKMVIDDGDLSHWEDIFMKYYG